MVSVHVNIHTTLPINNPLRYSEIQPKNVQTQAFPGAITAFPPIEN